MRIKELLTISLVGLGLAHAPDARAEERTWNAITGDFLNPANWTGGLPGGSDIAKIDNNGTATIGATAGNLSLSSLLLGSGGSSSGHIVMNGGKLTIGASEGDPRPIIGNGTIQSTFIMNGGEIWLDSPDQGGGASDYDGPNALDWEVGERGLGRFEMHGDSKFYASDDLKFSDAGGGTSEGLIDGNSMVAVGSGISVSGGANSHGMLTIGGNAIVQAGNSMGAGNPQGGSDEGYLTMASGGGMGMLTVQDNAQLHFRRLSAREGDSTITVKNRGQIHIYDVLNSAGTNAASRAAETGPNSTFVSAAGTGVITLQDDAQFTVNSDPASGPTKGIAISGPRDQGNDGGTAKLLIKDRALFRVEQDLSVGNGDNPASSDGTLEIVGPAANVSIGGNLNLAVDIDGNVAGLDGDGNPLPGKATLSAVITGSTHTTVNVTGAARLSSGRLKVKLDGHSPSAGASYTLVRAGSVSGPFLSTDFSEAPLADGLTWKVAYNSETVVLSVANQPGLPKSAQNAGVAPISTTTYINTGSAINNGNTESLGLAIGSNGNIIIGWEDDSDAEDVTYLGSVWTMYNAQGQPITPETTINGTVIPGGPIQSRFLSYFRADGSPIPGGTSWGPKIKANLFGEGVGMGATSYALSLEIPEYSAIENNSAGENAGDWPSVQLLTGSGQPISLLSGLDDAYAERAGDVRIGDWDFLSNGNVLIVGESRQRDDLVDVYGGEAAAIHAVFRIVSTNGTEVKPVTLVSETPTAGEIWHGSAVTQNGFAIRTGAGGQAWLRLFDNNGTPVSTNINLAEHTGLDLNATGGRGEGVGFGGNGRDAYVLAVGGTLGGTSAVWVTVLNANGSVRYSKAVANDVAITGVGRVHAAIDELGRVAVAFDALLPFDDGSQTVTNPRLVMGRVFDAQGNPLGGTFYLSEKELPMVGTPNSQRPRVAFRNGKLAIAWESLSAGTDKRTVALRTFDVGGGTVEDRLPNKPEDSGVSPASTTTFVNAGTSVNNGSTESLGVAIAANGNIIVGWEDDSENEDVTYLGSVWTMYNKAGQPITPETTINGLVIPGGPVQSRFLSYFRANGSATPGGTSWGPKIKANLFGEGVGMGATSYALSLEVPEFGSIENNSAGENAGDWPSVQLLTSAGQPLGILSGLDDAYAERPGDIRIGDWDYLANGNILIVGESRQRDDLVDVYGGEAAAIHAVFRIVAPNGTQVKPVTLASETPTAGEIWHGSAVTQNGFAIRTGAGGQAWIRLFDNNGTPVSTNINLAEHTGLALNAAGGRGEGVGFGGNGKDAYVLAVAGVQEETAQVWVTVLNANGTVRYSKRVSEDVDILSPGRVHAAIDENGRVAVFYDAQLPFDDGSGTVTNPRVVMGRVLDAAGNPLGGTFHVSEKELPVVGTPNSQRPRVAFRNGAIAVVWESLSAGNDKRTVALRTFDVGGGSTGGDIEVAISKAGPNSLRLDWEGGSGTFLVQHKDSLSEAQWLNVLTTTGRTAIVSNGRPHGFFRVVGGVTNNVIPLSVLLNGAAENPAVNTPAVGRGMMSLEGNKLSFDIRYSGLSGAATLAHIHGPAPADQNAGVLVNLAPFNGGAFGASGRLAGSVDLTDTQKASLLAGDTYVNIHTAANGGGEIRGQISPAILKAALSGAAERPTPVDTTATGAGTFILVGDELFVDLSYSGLKGPISNAHIHGPATAEAAAGVLVGVMNLHTGTTGTSTAASFRGSVVLNAATLRALIDGLTYFNIHSGFAGGGEIRGQIVP